MLKLAYTFLSLLMLTSCAEQYNIAGSSSVAFLDGRMLYLRVSPDGRSSDCLDSCKVVHGRFNFMGDVDSIMMAQLYMGDESVLPLVIENGNITIQVDNLGQHVTGGPLNDRLYGFLQKKNRLENEIWEVEQRCIRMMRSGQWSEENRARLNKQAELIYEEMENLETKFVMDNYDNVLGPGLFMMMCSQYPSPVITDQINRIIRKAPTQFMRNPFVENYLREARKNPRRREKKEEDE